MLVTEGALPGRAAAGEELLVLLVLLALWAVVGLRWELCCRLWPATCSVQKKMGYTEGRLEKRKGRQQLLRCRGEKIQS